MLFILVQWGDLIYFQSFIIYLRMSINSIPNCLFVLPHFGLFRYAQELTGGERGKKGIVPAWFPICYFSLGEKANLQ